MPLTSSVTASIAGLLTGTVDIGEVSHKVSFSPGVGFANGSGLNQADKMFADRRTLAASANESLDLSGVLLDAIGVALVFTKIKGILIRAAAANTNDVLVGPAAANGFVTPFGAATDRIKIPPGGFLLLAAPTAAGYAVTAGTGDLLFVGNSGAGTPVDYEIVLIGA